VTNVVLYLGLPGSDILLANAAVYFLRLRTARNYQLVIHLHDLNY